MRAGSSRTLTIAILLAFAMVSLGQLTKEARAAARQHTEPPNARQNAPGTSHTQMGNGSASPSAAAGNQDPNNPTASSLSVRGCLLHGNEGYVLEQEATQATFQLHGDSNTLNSGVNKTVEVHGRELQPVAASSKMPRFQVSELKVVAGQCPVTPKTALPNSGAATSANNPEPDATPRYEPNNPAQAPPAVPVNPNTAGTTGAPSAGTGNPPPSARPPAKPPQT
jgi:hypothetical protein